MKKKAFVGRERELEQFDQLWASEKAELVVLYGRRRVGKTRLLTHWLKTRGVRGFFWVAEPTSSAEQLRSFSQAVYDFANPDSPAPQTFTYASWNQAFQQVARIAATERTALVIDEFTYLLEVEPGIGAVLQTAWDHHLSGQNLLLALSGSHIGMMQRNVLAHQAPLYGRATAVYQLEPLPFSQTRAYFRNYSPAERVELYAMLGGVPAYWERFAPDLSVEENVRRQFLTTNKLMQDEPRLLLQDFIVDLHNYAAILRAIAHNARTPKEISRHTGLDEKSVPKYLRVLIETGFVERRIPVTAPQSSRRGRHVITDPYLRFYYRFLAHRQAQFALGVQERALDEIRQYLPQFVGMHTWEELCRRWLLFAGAYGRLPVIPDQVGSAWTRAVQVDVVGVNSTNRIMVLGECKWTAERVGGQALKDLVGKADAIVGKGRWQVYFLIFARNGLTEPAWEYAASVEEGKVSGKNWEAMGMAHIDLETLDDDLLEWET